MRVQIQSRLLRWAAIFLFIFSSILTLAPAVRERSWNVEYKFSHWAGFGAWVVLVFLVNRALKKYLPEADPYIFPAAALLSGWGLLTIWRLDEAFGIRQLIWLTIILALFMIALQIPHHLFFLRRYKYILLSSGLLITALTIIFGTNPLGGGPRLWLGCCGVYFQPSEPLKLLLVVYLAAYLADHPSARLSSFPLLVPTVIVIGFALLLLLVQRDLGTASIFVSIYAMVLYLATGKRRVLLSAILTLGFSLLIGYFFINIVRIRMDAWLNPWNDPAGNSFQIVQSLLAVANGGIVGRGPGLGSPLLVPVAISDFIFSAIAEETGLVGVVGLLVIIWIILARGLIIAIHAADRFRRLLAAGVVSYLGFQSLLIIGGNLRLFPLTGVTLPFVSYGGSSLLTAFVSLLFLIIISDPEDEEPVSLPDPRPYAVLAGLLALSLAAFTLTVSWWTVVRGQELLNRTDNARRAIADRYVPRGSIVDRNNHPIDTTEGESGNYTRVYKYPNLAPIIGYTNPIFGQAGVEASMDNYLRGLQGNPASLVWWDRLLYGTPPPGLDVRLSIDLSLQTTADQLLGGHHGAVVLMNAKTGEILTMVSHPTYDPNKLNSEGNALAKNPSTPLVNRAAQGLYPVGTITLPFLRAEFGKTSPSAGALRSLYAALGFYQAPVLNIPVASDHADTQPKDLHISPLQLVLAASALSNQGIIPPPRMTIAVNTSEQGWVVLPAKGQPVDALQAQVANDAALTFIVGGKPYWSHTGQASAGQNIITWLVSGTLPDWGGTPLALVVMLEENNTFLAEHIRTEIMTEALR